MDRVFFILGAVSGAIAVMLGAFGAHALRSSLSPERLATFETGVRYEMYHALALLAVSLAAAREGTSGWMAAAGIFFVLGTLLFSGSLYLLAATKARWLGAITPLGGIAFIAGWLLLALSAL